MNFIDIEFEITLPKDDVDLKERISKSIEDPTSEIRKEFPNINVKDTLKLLKSGKSKLLIFKNGLDWRRIRQEDVDSGAGFGYGTNLEPGNYVGTVKNQHVPSYSGTCWAFSTVSVYSNTYKIAQVASGEKNILEAEIGRRNLSVQYIADLLGSPDSKYRKNMDKERKKLFDKFGGHYRGGGFTLCCQILKEIGVCVYENYNPFLAISRDLTQSGSEWYKTKQYVGVSSELPTSEVLSLSNLEWPSLFPGNNTSLYKSGNVKKGDPSLITPFKSIERFSRDITKNNYEGYRNATKDKIDISYIRIVPRTKRASRKKKFFRKIAEQMKLFIAMFGPMGIGYNCLHTYYSTTVKFGQKIYNYEDTKKNIIKWQKGIISDKTFNRRHSNKKSNHAVEIVGWTPPNKKTGRECWIVKNSFGELCGDNGYLLMPLGINAFKCEFHPDIMLHNQLLSNEYKNILNTIKKNVGDKDTKITIG